MTRPIFVPFLLISVLLFMLSDVLAVEQEKAGTGLLALLPLHEWAGVAHLLARARAFNLDDLGSHIGQNHGAKGASDDVSGVQNTDTLQR